MNGAEFVAEARRWIGTPYQHQASLRGVAADCIGLIAGAAAALGSSDAARWANDPRRRSYAKLPDAKMLLGAAPEYMQPIAVDDLAPGDVLVLRWHRDPRHFAIVSSIDPLRVIHAYASAGEVVENILDSRWRARIVCAYRLRGVG